MTVPPSTPLGRGDAAPATPPSGTDTPGVRVTAEPREASVGDLIALVSDNLSTLMRQEVALAKAEVKQTATNAGMGAGMLGGAAWAAHFVLLFLSLALWWGLATAIGDGALAPALGISGLIVAAIWAVVAGILALVGKKKLSETKGLPQTAETVSRIPNALKGEEHV